tara:strand:+ start:340 stop:690 length:351 start_codon:yes stop_codon:yes gene_type:complete
MPPLVSVIVPVFGRPKRLDLAIQSVLEQTNLPRDGVEIIVVDDASPVTTSIGLSSEANIIRRKLNGGPAAARNTGVEAANGKFISFLDSDDLWLPNKLANQLALFETISKNAIRLF